MVLLMVEYFKTLHHIHNPSRQRGNLPIYKKGNHFKSVNSGYKVKQMSSREVIMPTPLKVGRQRTRLVSFESRRAQQRSRRSNDMNRAQHPGYEFHEIRLMCVLCGWNAHYRQNSWHGGGRTVH